MALAVMQATKYDREVRPLHPFFSRLRGPEAQEQTQDTLASIEAAKTAENGPNKDAVVPEGGQDKSRTANARGQDGADPKDAPGFERDRQTNLTRYLQTRCDSGTHISEGILEQKELSQTGIETKSLQNTSVAKLSMPSEDKPPSLEEDPNHERRKRLGTDISATLPSCQTHLCDNEMRLETGKVLLPFTKSRPVAQADASNSSAHHNTEKSESLGQERARCEACPETTESESSKATPDPETEGPPTKLLRLNGAGKFSSTVSDKSSGQIIREGGKARVRRRKEQPSRLLVTLRYGQGESGTQTTGHRIDMILAGKDKVMKRKGLQTQGLQDSRRPHKSTHPFFLAKRAPTEQRQTNSGGDSTSASANLANTRPKKCSATPGTLRSDLHSAPRSTSPAYRATSNQTKTYKYPGMHDAPWPWAGATHVRPDGIQSLVTQNKLEHELTDERKNKGHAANISSTENVLNIFATQISNAIATKAGHADSFRSLPRTLRLPERCLTTSFTIKQLVDKELSVSFADRSEPPEASFPNPIHPALAVLWDEIESNLTAFDTGTCESQPWTRKYSPTRADRVLQRGNEAIILRDWLKSLTITAIEGASKDNGKLALKKEPRNKPPKKKKRKNDLDDFIVSEDEEDEHMDELVGPEDSSPVLGGQPPRRSLVRSEDFSSQRSRRVKNAILISGPNGCGKSAGVYAVAKELGFEVFEINPGSRRSGKDILDRVGDMAENHLVQHPPEETVAPPAAVDSDIERVDAAFQSDLKSGRQGTMTAFFKASQTNIGAGETTRAKVGGSPKSKKKTDTIKKVQPQKQQKQSLILLEEVDVIFEEDKQFWSTVAALALQSKRPIIMTCNDEHSVPQEDFSFQAILRFSPPPEALATDYMLLLAAREGHLLKRSTVSNLYKSRNKDLRASITEMNYWCQMAIGDRKGGLEWIYQRWPPNKDVDERGERFRIASKGTYCAGMGWLSHDIACSPSNIFFDRDEEMLKEMWMCWNIPPEGVLRTDAFNLTVPGSAATLGTVDDIEDMETYAEGVSAADVYARVGLPGSHDGVIDPTTPPLPQKMRLNFVGAAQLVQADEVVDHLNLDFNIAVASYLAAYRQLLKRWPICDRHSTNNAAIESPFSQANLNGAILKHKKPSSSKANFTASDIINAFHPITIDIQASPFTPPIPLTQFDRPLSIITSDLAPYVRSVALYDLRLEAARLRLSNLLSAGGRNGKRQRNTRASRSALEGGPREYTRRERWFGPTLNLKAVLCTAGDSWAGLGAGNMEHSQPNEQTLGESNAANSLRDQNSEVFGE